MNLTTPQMVLLGFAALVAIGVGGTVFYLAVQNIRSLYRATATNPRTARVAMLVGAVGGAVIGLGVLGHIVMVLTRY